MSRPWGTIDLSGIIDRTDDQSTGARYVAGGAGAALRFLRGLRAPLGPARLANLLWFVAFEGAYYLAYRYSMQFSQALPAPFWLPDSILLCAFLKARPRYWWIFILGALPVRLFSDVAHGLPLWFLVGAGIVNFTQTVLVATLLRRSMNDPMRFSALRDLIVFFGIAVVGGPALAAFGGAALRSLLGYDYWQTWENWFLGNALAQLVVTPALFYWVFDDSRPRKDFNVARATEAGIIAVGLAASGYLATHIVSSPIAFDEAADYAPIPFLIWAVIRFGMPGACGAQLIMAIFAVEAALNGRGPYRGLSPPEVSFALRSFLLLRSAAVYLIAVVIEHDRAAERALRASEQLFRKLTDNAPILIWMSGPDRRCNYLNRYWLEFTGRTIEESLGTGWTDSIHPDDREHCFARSHAAVHSRQPLEIDFRLRRHDGEYRWIADFGVPRYAPDGTFAGYIGSGIDITDRRRAEEDHRALAHAQRLAVMGELTATIAHELRQPLTALLLDTEVTRKLLAEHPDIPDLQETLQDMRDNAVRADGVISRIRSFLGNPAPGPKPCAPNDIVEDVLVLVGRDLQRRAVKIQTEFGHDLPPVAVDPMQIQQVLINLIANGMDAMQPVTTHAHQLTLGTRKSADGEWVEFSVSDAGTGITPDHLKLLFNSFWSTKTGGMGLGLSIARTIVQAYHGRIWAENNPGDGATFYFVLPAAAPEA